MPRPTSCYPSCCPVPVCSDPDLGLGLGSLWNVATAVTSAVKQTADEVVKSVQQTDWKSELATFTHEVEAEAQKAVEVVQHLPQHITHAPGKTQVSSTSGHCWIPPHASGS